MYSDTNRIAALVVMAVTAACMAPTTAAFAFTTIAPLPRTAGGGGGSSSWNTKSTTISHRRRAAAAAAATITSASAVTVNGSSEKAVAAANGAAARPSTTTPPTPIDNIRLNVNEKARTVTSVCTSGTLCTISSSDGIEGAPFGSFVDYVLDDNGNPVFLMNEMSMHTVNIRKASELQQRSGGVDGDKHDGQALVTLFTQLGSNPQGGDGDDGNASTGLSATPPGADGKSKGLQDVSRCSLTGTLERIDRASDDMDTIRMRYSLTHTYADQVMDSPKFAFYRLKPRKIYFVGGFGVLAKWVDPQEYATANPDILAKEASDIVNRINMNHKQDLYHTAQQLLDVTNEIQNIRVTNVDRLGMDVRVTSLISTRRNRLETNEFRIGFRIPVISVEDAKSEILKVFQEAWEKANGYTWGDDGGDAGHGTERPGESIPIMKIAADSLE